MVILILPAKTGKQRHIAIHLDHNLCKRCGICVAFCPQGVFVTGDDGYPVVAATEKCTGCQLCFYRCPDFAVEVEVDK
ncbi:MAG: ferredoxin family protein [Clostridia bacterium]|nr:MAG: ferredoxin family protein [Clostridia bacterium]